MHIIQCWQISQFYLSQVFNMCKYSHLLGEFCHECLKKLLDCNQDLCMKVAGFGDIRSPLYYYGSGVLLQVYFLVETCLWVWWKIHNNIYEENIPMHSRQVSWSFHIHVLYYGTCSIPILSFRVEQHSPGFNSIFLVGFHWNFEGKTLSVLQGKNLLKGFVCKVESFLLQC